MEKVDFSIGRDFTEFVTRLSLQHLKDIPILQNGLVGTIQSDLEHGLGQIGGRNTGILTEQFDQRIQPTRDGIHKVRFFARNTGVDIGRSEAEEDLS